MNKFVVLLVSVLLSAFCQGYGMTMTATIYRCESGKYGTRNNLLIPYFSAAVPKTMSKRFPYGTIMYVKQFDGAKMKNGGRHNGYFRVDDVCVGTCWVQSNVGSKTYPVFDIHVGRHGKIGSGNTRIRVTQKKKANLKRLERYAKRMYHGVEC